MRASNQSQSISTQTGIRQRSLRKHCRLGRATELVFVMATGAMLVLSGGAQAQVVWSTGESGPQDANPGTLEVSGGIYNNRNGIVDTLTTVSGGVLNNTLGQLKTQTNVTAGGTLNSSGGAITGTLTNNGGNVNITGGTAEKLTNTSGTLNITGGTVSGLVTNSATVNSNVTVQRLINTAGGEYNNNAGSKVTGLTTIDGGKVINVGTLEGATTIAAAGILDNNTGGTVGAVTNSSTTGSTNAGTIASLINTTGNFINESGGTISGTTAVTDGIVTNTGTLTGTTTVAAAGRLNSSGTLTGMVTNNGGTVNITGGTARELRNTSGTMTIMGSSAVSGKVLNDGSLIVKGNSVTIAGSLSYILTDASARSITMNDNSATTLLAVAGNADISGTINFDVDLSKATPGADKITVGGSLSGEVNLVFDNIAGSADHNGTIDLITYGGTNTLSILGKEGLPINGPFIYDVEDNSAGKIQLTASLNEVITNLAATVGLTQTIVGAIVNRPTSPFVSDYVGDKSEDACGKGFWSRLTGGEADAEGTATDVTINTSTTAPVSLSYGGIQMGGDFACFGGHYNGWDMAFGGIAGFNKGSTSSNVFKIDADTGLATTVVDSITSTDIEQAYGGVYLTAAKGSLFTDLQYRYDNTEFTSNNTAAVGGEGFDLGGAAYESKGHTVSGSVGYSWPIGTVEGLNFVSSVGFSFSDLSTDAIDLGANGTLQINDSESQIGFASATIAKSKVLPDEISILSYFGTLTYYNDFADDPTAVFTKDEVARKLTLSNLGSYTELSAGVNYVRLLSPGDAGNARQLNAAVRVDARVGDDVESWGIAGQLRLQF